MSSSNVKGVPIKIGGPTTKITTGVAEDHTIVDLANMAKRPKFVMLSVIGAGGVLFKPYFNLETTPADADLAMLPGGQVLVVDVSGEDTIRILQGSAAEVIFITPLANEGPAE